MLTWGSSKYGSKLSHLWMGTYWNCAATSFPTQVRFLGRNPSLHDYTIWFQYRGSKLQNQVISAKLGPLSEVRKTAMLDSAKKQNQVS